MSNDRNGKTREREKTARRERKRLGEILKRLKAIENH